MTDQQALNNTIKLVVGTQTYEGWQSWKVARSIEQMAGAFSLQVTLKWPGREDAFELREGLACTVMLGEDTLITGYIDEYEPEYDADSSVITVHGRDKTGDLVDCAAIYKTGQWRNAELLQIVTDIAAPFGIAVVVNAGVDLGEPFKSFALEEGETAFCAIDRACRMRAVLCTSTPLGEVLLTRASTDTTGVQLIEGLNILSAGAKHSWKERFSKVTLKGQGKGDDSESGATVAHVKAEALDGEINRYRPMVVVAEHGAGLKALSERAQWETQVRMGRGKRGHIAVAGFRTGRDGLSGAVWVPNREVYIDSPRLQLAQDMLIVGCEYSMDDKKGRITQLTFARPEAFEVVAGVRRSKLSQKINHRTQAEKHKRGKGLNYNSPWDLSAPHLDER